MAPRRWTSAPAIRWSKWNALDTEVGNTFSYIDNLSMVRGLHTFKTGVDIRRIQLNNSGNTLTHLRSCDQPTISSTTKLSPQPISVRGWWKSTNFLPGILSGRAQLLETSRSISVCDTSNTQWPMILDRSAGGRYCWLQRFLSEGYSVL
jgi:hypothetical protein